MAFTACRDLFLAVRSNAPGWHIAPMAATSAPCAAGRNRAAGKGLKRKSRPCPSGGIRKCLAPMRGPHPTRDRNPLQSGGRAIEAVKAVAAAPAAEGLEVERRDDMVEAV